MKYSVLDCSYGNIRLIKQSGEMIVMDRVTLNELINTSVLKEVKEKRYKYPHLVLDNIKKS